MRFELDARLPLPVYRITLMPPPSNSIRAATTALRRHDTLEHIAEKRHHSRARATAGRSGERRGRASLALYW